MQYCTSERYYNSPSILCMWQPVLSLFSQRSHLQLEIKRLCKHTEGPSLLFHQYNNFWLKQENKRKKKKKDKNCLLELCSTVFLLDSVMLEKIFQKNCFYSKLHKIGVRWESRNE